MCHCKAPRVHTRGRKATWGRDSTLEELKPFGAAGYARRIRHTPHTLRGTIGSSSEGSSAAARMRHAHP
eukprot:6671637-Pyramimonas_sp.AAC.1